MSLERHVEAGPLVVERGGLGLGFRQATPPMRFHYRGIAGCFGGVAWLEPGLWLPRSIASGLASVCCLGDIHTSTQKGLGGILHLGPLHPSNVSCPGGIMCLRPLHPCDVNGPGGKLYLRPFYHSNVSYPGRVMYLRPLHPSNVHCPQASPPI